MSKLAVRAISFFTLLSLFFSPIGLAPASASFAGANGKILLIDMGDVWVMDVGGPSPINLTNSTEIESSPRWAPDGLRIAYVCLNQEGICLIGPDGSDFQVLIDIGGGAAAMVPASGGSVISSVDWHPYGGQLLYVKDGDLWGIATNGTNNTLIMPHGGILSARYIPTDGSKIVYDTNLGISVVDWNGLNDTPLTVLGGDVAPDWSPDGAKIVFQSGDGSTRDLWIMDADGQNPENLTLNTTDLESTPSWLPDSSKVLFTRPDGLWTVDPGDKSQVQISTQVATEAAWQPLNVFVVNSPNDASDDNPGDGICETATPGECTLRAAIEQVNAISAPNALLTIFLNENVMLTNSLPPFNNLTAQKVTLYGNDHTIDGQNTHQLVSIAANTTVYLQNVTLTKGQSVMGGAIHNEGALKLIKARVTNNVANQKGGGINNNGSLYIYESTIDGNLAISTPGGGGINNEGSLTIANSTISGNVAAMDGGGIANQIGSTAQLYNVTIFGNQAGSGRVGGGYAALGGASSNTLINTILVGNTLSGGGTSQEIFMFASATYTVSHNLYGHNGLTTAEAIAGITPDSFDLLLTNDGGTPFLLNAILNPTLGYNDGPTPTHYLVNGSPALNAADSAICAAYPVSGHDQRDVPRSTSCDIGAYEKDTNLFFVTNTNDSGPGSLRQAIEDANITLNIDKPDEISFAILSDPPHIISPLTNLPTITDPLIVGKSGSAILDGASAGSNADGITINTGNTTIKNLTITNFDGAGIAVIDGLGNRLNENSIYGNQGLDIDLGDDGVTFNHTGIVTGPTPNNYQNYPVLELATSDGSTLRLAGSLQSSPYETYTIDVYANDTCHPTFFGGGKTHLGYFTLSTSISDTVEFDQTLSIGETEPTGITVTATHDINGTSEFSYCRPVATPNLNWAQAQSVSDGSSTQQYITDNFQEKWFKFAAQPGARVKITLQGQPGSILSLHSDPYVIYEQLIEPEDETALSAESADVAFLPSGFLPSGFLPSGFLASGALPFGPLPSGFLPSGSLPSGELPSGSLPAGALPSGFLPSGFLPSDTLPSGFLPSGFLPSGSTDAYATAARRSLLGISMNPNAAEQVIERNTFDYLGDLYVRVVGPYDLSNPFTVQVEIEGGICNAITQVPNTLQTINGAAPEAGTRKTLIVTDSSRLAGTPLQISAAMSNLQTLAERAEVDAVIIDLSESQYERVAWANTQADANLGCPTARNLVATEIKKVIDEYWAANAASLEYIVLAGGNNVIPFFQVQDVAEIANEKDYIVPVEPLSASEAALRNNLVPTQDGYGSEYDFKQGGFKLAYPGLAVGRLVNNAEDVSTAVNAYIALNGIIQPDSSLVTGYDFVGDGAAAIKDELNAGTGATADTLIQPPGEAPNGPNSWSASDLATQLLASKHDIVMFTGHFSAGDLLAADYESQLTSLGLANSAVDLNGTLVLTLGCHGGYTIPGTDLIPGISPNPDWAKAVLRKGAAGYIAATGYAYGDTELVEYGERLFLLLARELRTGSQPVSIGHALMEAKREYLSTTAQITGVDQKSIIETTLYGLPMMKVDMPGQRIDPQGGDAPDGLVQSITPVTDGPGMQFGLGASDVISISPSLTEHTKNLQNVVGGGSLTASYFSGPNGVISNPYEPILPKAIYDVHMTGNVLRGIAFRGGPYTDSIGVIPLTGAPSTETSTAHKSFNSRTFYPNIMWMANYQDVFEGGHTKMVAFPVQYKSVLGQLSGIQRVFDSLDLQFYYLPNSWSTPETRAAAISPAPSVLGVTATENGTDVDFQAHVTADGLAGVQDVWILYTGKPGSPYYGEWLPLDLTQDPDSPDFWNGTLALAVGAETDDLLFMVQAVGGAGLTTLKHNDGAYYRIRPETPLPPAEATTLTLLSPPAAGIYQHDAEFILQLMAGGNPVENRIVTLSIGELQSFAVTDGNGEATLSVNLSLLPESYNIQAAFEGDDSYLSSNATGNFTVNKETVTLSITPSSSVTLDQNVKTPYIATIEDSLGRPLVGKSVVFVLSNSEHTVSRSVKSNYLGKAPMGIITLPEDGAYTIDVHFSGVIPVSNGGNLTLEDPYYESAVLENAGTLISSAPTASVTATKADSTTYTPGSWTNQTVTVHFDCSDIGSGIAFCPADQVYSAEGTFMAEGTATDNAGNSVLLTFGPIRIDKTAPTLAPKVTPNPAFLKSAITVSANATDSKSGIATTSCGAVSTASIGLKSVTCSATDHAGNAKSASVSYRVIYKFQGFYKPVYNLPTLNRMKAGLGVSITFGLNGNQGLNIFATGYPKVIKIACGTAPIQVIQTIAAPISSKLTYNATSKRYVYKWKTSAAWAGSCRQFIVKLKDGRIYRLNFKFTP